MFQKHIYTSDFDNGANEYHDFQDDEIPSAPKASGAKSAFPPPENKPKPTTGVTRLPRPPSPQPDQQHNVTSSTMATDLLGDIFSVSDDTKSKNVSAVEQFGDFEHFDAKLVNF